MHIICICTYVQPFTKVIQFPIWFILLLEDMILLSILTMKYFQHFKNRIIAWSKKSIHVFFFFLVLMQLKTLTHAMQTAKANAANAQAAATGAQKSLREKEELVDAAKRRVEELSSQLKNARQELANTNRAAARASAAASEAKANASRNKRRLENIRKMRTMKKR